MKLHEYQVDAVEKVRKALREGKRRILLVAPTGSGKTVMSAHIMSAAAERYRPSLFVAHRREIIHQTSEKLGRFDCQHGIILSGERKSVYPLVQVASIQTYHARIVRGNGKPPPADLVVIDEAHRSTARTYQEMAAGYPDSVFIGTTATPCRGDGRGLGGFWDALVEATSIEELMSQGYLVRPRYFAPSIPDLAGVKVRAGDYAKGDLENAVNTNKLVGDIVRDWQERGQGRQTVVFASGVAHSKHITEQFTAAGIKAAHIDGTTPSDERDDILQKLESGDIRIVSNSDVLLEGWDCPPVECAVLARPTKSYGLYLQMAGRVLRTSNGKTDCIILDHSGAVYRHGFVEDSGGWSLDPDKKIADIRMEKAAKEKEMTTCRECFSVYENSDHCPNCGWMPTKIAKKVNMAEGTLREVKRVKRKVIDKQTIWNNALWRCIRSGKKTGVAAHIYRKETGVWPARLECLPHGKAEWNMLAKDFYERRDK